MYEFGSGGECELKLDSNMYNFIKEEFQTTEVLDIKEEFEPKEILDIKEEFQPNETLDIKEEFQTKEILDILDLDKLNTANQITGIENPSNITDSEDFSVCSQLNEHFPSRSVPEDYNFRFLRPYGDMIDPPWKNTNNFADNNIKMPEFFGNYSYSASPLIYSDVIRNDDNTLSNTNNISQNYNTSEWNPELNKTDSIPVPLTNTRKVLNILETNDTSRKMPEPGINSFNGFFNLSQQGVKNIENIHVLQNKPRSSIENEQENSVKKNVVRIVLHRRKDILTTNKSNETVERYQVVLPPVRRSRDYLQTFKTQKEDTQKERIMSISEDNPERVQKVPVIPVIKIPKFICQICRERFVTRYSLITHMKSHRQPFCSSCITLYKSREQLRQHIHRMHMVPAAPEVTVVTSKYGRKRQVFCPLSLMARRRSMNNRLIY